MESIFRCQLFISLLFFYSLLFFTKKGFATECDEFTKGNKTLKEFYSPNYPSSYPASVQCDRLIEAPENHSIQIQFSTPFRLESQANCEFDYVEIRDGKDANAPKLARFCGSDLPPPTSSTGNKIFLRFKSDDSDQLGGFIARYSFVNESERIDACDSFIPDSILQTFSSPLHPSNYPPSSNCVAQIEAPANNTILITFTSFQLESHSDCNYDFLELHDGGAGHRRIAKLCGLNVPQPIQSTTNKVWMRFKSDASDSMSGFTANYIFINRTEVAVTTCSKFSEGNQTAKTFWSPQYPSNYPSLTICTRTITAPENHTIVVRFNGNINMEACNNCNCDYIEFRDGLSATSPVLEKLCGNSLPPMVQSTTNEMYIKFRSDGSSQGNGFSATYWFSNETVVNENCVNFTKGDEATKQFSSPGWPTYYNFTQCEKLITAPPNKTILLTFVGTFYLEHHSECNYDFLEVRDGSNFQAPLLAKMCGNGLPPPLLSTGNQMWLRFRSDSSREGSGFNAKYEFVNATFQLDTCQNFTVGNGSTFYSPNWPNMYPKNAACDRIISAPENHTILIRFLDKVMLETSTECQYDSLEVRDGRASSSTLLRRICGIDDVAPIQSTGNHLWLRFKSDTSNQFKGFIANFTFLNESSKCSAFSNTNNSKKQFSSPLYPNPYPANTICDKVITAPSNNFIIVYFHSFQLESSSGCTYDYVEIRDGANDQAPIIKKFCGAYNPERIASRGNYMWLRFRSDGSNQLAGFNATYDFRESIHTVHNRSDIETKCGPGNWTLFKNYKCIWLFKQLVTNFGAEKLCHREHATLLQIKSAEEHNFIKNLNLVLQLHTFAWLGAKRSKIVNYHFAWFESLPLNYSNFAIGEPNDLAHSDCLKLSDDDGKWYDAPCLEQNAFYCQKLIGEEPLGKVTSNDDKPSKLSDTGSTYWDKVIIAIILSIGLLFAVLIVIYTSTSFVNYRLPKLFSSTSTETLARVSPRSSISYNVHYDNVNYDNVNYENRFPQISRS